MIDKELLFYLRTSRESWVLDLCKKRDAYRVKCKHYDIENNRCQASIPVNYGDCVRANYCPRMGRYDRKILLQLKDMLKNKDY